MYIQDMYDFYYSGKDSFVPNNGLFISKNASISKYAGYINPNNSYSGADIVATITVPSIGRPIIIGELQTISYSIYRPKIPVRALGRINPKGYARGGRTIAGSLIFTVFDKHIVYSILESINGLNYRLITDELPPFDVTITFSNEHGQKSILSIYGVEIVNEGQTMSIENIITENVMNYVATGIDLMKVSKK